MKWMGWTAARSAMIATVMAGALSACGGGDDKPDDKVTDAGVPRTDVGGSGSGSGSLSSGTINDAEAHRFLAQASFGATPAAVLNLKSLGYAGWIDNQYEKSLAVSHVATVDASTTRMGADKPRFQDIPYTWWTHAVTDQAQLRQRVAYALSQIFVVSTVDSTLSDNARLVASYMDMLTQRSSGTYRELLEAVTLHPAMGVYLSSLQNRKEDPGSGRVPDENFAREVMQLFSIGLYDLNDDGSLKLRSGQPVETYTPDDVRGLAKVFTGLSWHRPAGADWSRCFWANAGCNDASLQTSMPMTAYAEMHSTSEKRFLGVTIPEQTTADPAQSLRVALNRLATHPNTAPFISKQLIQRLVTSNPTPGYVARVTAVFRSTNGNLRSVVKAILMDAEARTPATSGVNMTGYGKVREPVLRLTQLLRAIPHNSTTYTAMQTAATPNPAAFYRAVGTEDPATALGQTPMRSPSVFNFYRPGYKPPRSQLGTLQLVAPEMQITSETSVLGYANFLTTILEQGWGDTNAQTGKPDIQFNLATLLALDDGSDQARPQRLVDDVARRLLGAPLPGSLNERVVTAVGAMPHGTEQQKRRRVIAAISLVALSPSYIVQQ